MTLTQEELIKRMKQMIEQSEINCERIREALRRSGQHVRKRTDDHEDQQTHAKT